VSDLQKIFDLGLRTGPLFTTDFPHSRKHCADQRYNCGLNFPPHIVALLTDISSHRRACVSYVEPFCKLKHGVMKHTLKCSTFFSLGPLSQLLLCCSFHDQHLNSVWVCSMFADVHQLQSLLCGITDPSNYDKATFTGNVFCDWNRGDLNYRHGSSPELVWSNASHSWEWTNGRNIAWGSYGKGVRCANLSVRAIMHLRACSGCLSGSCLLPTPKF
jgi:hypothetical protein